MKNFTKKTLAVLLVVCTLAALSAFMVGCGGKPVKYTFAYTYVPQTDGVESVTFELKLYEDGTLELTPGVMVNASDDGKHIVGDGTATGTWIVNEAETLNFTIIDAKDSTVKNEYTVEKKDGTYEFELNVIMSNFKRVLPMKLQK